MMSLQTILGLLFLLNFLSLAIIILSFLKIAPGRVRNSFLLLMFLNQVWFNAIFIFRIPGIDSTVAIYISRIIFAFSYLMFLSFAHFLLSFSGEEKIRGWFVYPVLLSGAVMVGASLLGLVEDGVRLTENGLRPVYGLLHPYFIGSLVISGIILFVKIWINYRNSPTEIIKFQMQSLLWSAFGSFSGIVLTNGLIPALTGSARFSAVGPFFPLLFFAGIIYILSNGPAITVKKSFNRLLRQASGISDKNIATLREFIGLIQFLLKDNPEQFRRQLRFDVSGSDPVALYVGRDEDEDEKRNGTMIKDIPRNWMKGFMDSLLTLEADNKRLAFSLVRANQLFREKWLQEAVDEIPGHRDLPALDFYNLEEFSGIIAGNRNEYVQLFGVDMICFSAKFQEVLGKMMRYSRSHQVIVIEGETGTGRSLLARAMHHYRGAGELTEFSCLSESPEKIRGIVRNFMEAPPKERPEGLLIRHVDTLEPDSFPVLEPVLNDLEGKKFVYLTASPDFLVNPPRLHGDLLFRLKQLSLRTLPLRKRADDIFYQVLYFVMRYSGSSHLNYLGVSRKVLERAMEYSWPGNTRELENAVQRAVLDNLPPVLEEMQLNHNALFPEGRGDLSPLEESERNVIINYLRKNNYNKSQTMRDLKITINTLNAKIKRYGISVQGGGKA